MQCPFCHAIDSKVVDSRSTTDHLKIRRRRECLQCGGRFTTYEMLESNPLVVVKKDHSRQLFDRDKLLNRLLRACGKRPVSLSVLEKVVVQIETELQNSFVHEVASGEIAELAMQKLKDIDVVAYIRFVSVYREFRSINEFLDELSQLKDVER